MKSNLFQAFTNPEFTNYMDGIKYVFMYGAKSNYEKSEDTEILTVENYENVNDDDIFEEEE